jgi:ectoine hydroxylase-related dioxygenase (phytanoyl-CoA dioxygenase family)
MASGSAVVYLGNTLHGGGANRTRNETRRGMFMGFCLGWLRTEENFFLSTPIEAVRGMPQQVQELLGYEAHLGIGVVDVGSPMKLVRQPS